MVYLRNDPFVLVREHVRRHRGRVNAFHVHHDETGGIPYLVRKIAARVHLGIGEAHVVAGRVAGDQRQTERVRAVSVDDLQRIYAVAKGLAHLAAELVADQAVDKNRVEGTLPCLLVG